MSVLISETDAERRIIDETKRELARRVESASIDEIAVLLDLHRDGVRSLLLKEWPLQKAFRIAYALDFDLTEAL